MVDFNLPRKKTWDYYDIKEAETRSIAPGDRFNIFPKQFPEMPSEAGWVLMAALLFDHGDMGLRVKMTGLSRDFEGEVSVNTLRNVLGYIQPLPAQVWSPIAGVAAFTPPFPGVPYRKLVVDAVNLGTVAHNLLSWELVLVPVIEESEEAE